MAYEGPLEDRLAIRERIETYGDAVFRRDAEAWIANWAEDAVWSLPGFEVVGKAAIKRAWIQAMSAFSLAAFFGVPGSIVVRGETATARVHTQEILTDAQGGVRRVVGVYDDELIREGGEWLFRKRLYQIKLDQKDG